MTKKLFSSAQIGPLHLANHVVMAPMTRSRAEGGIPNALMARYYGQRTGAGLIITEGTSPSPNGLGYARIPGIYSAEQVAGWQLVTQAVHDKGGKIFVQLMHTGRIGHALNLPAGAAILAPSVVRAQGDMWTDQEGMQPHPTPKAMEAHEVQHAITEFVQAATNAVQAGFDGVELHAANGYLIEQFLSPFSNQRTDQYGGSIENRSRFLLETARQTAEAIGKDKVGVRLSPYGVYNDMPLYDAIDETYEYLAQKLDDLGILYIHLVDHSAAGAPAVSPTVVQKIRNAFGNALMLSGGYTPERAEAVLQSGQADLVAFGKPFISNPDLVERWKTGAQEAAYDPSTFYAGGEKGYIDYPVLEKQTV